ncbi:MAG: diadenylate cyclase CdaA [Alphaproteobacteria bacterium]|nr:diadenylate cyclase CdaA [Alphaproteobacteria bacterium]
MDFFIHHLINILQVVLIAIACWLFYKRFIKNTNSERLVRGILGLVVLWLSSWLFLYLKLGILGEFTRLIAIVLSIGTVVVFQPELRKFFAMMGHMRFLRILFSPSATSDAATKAKIQHDLDEIVSSVAYMSKRHTGALIVFRNEFDGTIENLGTKINAEISSELILTIFFDKTPLHDGAMIIGGGHILYAGAVLPLTQKSDLNWRYGTRHRAAIGMSEASDSVVLVVSEETGTISIAENGKLTKYDDMKKLKARLEKAIN